jgi:hypothetical protein
VDSFQFAGPFALCTRPHGQNSVMPWRRLQCRCSLTFSHSVALLSYPNRTSRLARFRDGASACVFQAAGGTPPPRSAPENVSVSRDFSLRVLASAGTPSVPSLASCCVALIPRF